MSPFIGGGFFWRLLRVCCQPDPCGRESRTCWSTPRAARSPEGLGRAGGTGRPPARRLRGGPVRGRPPSIPFPQGESALDSGFSVGCKAGETPALGPWLTQGAGREALRDSAGHRKTRPGESGAHAPAAG